MAKLDIGEALRRAVTLPADFNSLSDVLSKLEKLFGGLGGLVSQVITAGRVTSLIASLFATATGDAGQVETQLVAGITKALGDKAGGLIAGTVAAVFAKGIADMKAVEAEVTAEVLKALGLADAASRAGALDDEAQRVLSAGWDEVADGDYDPFPDDPTWMQTATDPWS